MNKIEVTESTSVSNYQDSSDRIYLFGLAIGLIHYMLPETTIEAPEVIELLLKATMFFVLSLQLVIAFPKYSSPQKLLIILLFIAVVGIGYSTTFWGTIYSLFALVVGAKGIDYRKILNVYFKVGGLLCLTVVTLSLSGFIENRAVLSEGHGFNESTTIRYCLGYIWPTDFASHVFFILLSYWMLKKCHLNLLRIFLFVSVSYSVYSYSDSKLGSGCILLLVLISIYLSVKEKIFRRFNFFPKSTLFARFVWSLYIPFLFFISVWATASYDEGDLLWIAVNASLSGRLSLGQEMLQKEGFTWFGQEIHLSGGLTDANLYNYIDSSYLQSLIIYGLLFSITLLYAYMVLANRAYKRNNVVFLYAMFVAGISGVVAQHFIQIFMNPLLISLTASNVIIADCEDLASKRSF